MGRQDSSGHAPCSEVLQAVRGRCVLATCEAPGLEDHKEATYAAALRALLEVQVPFLVGGAFALFSYSGRMRPTKDMDLFLRSADLPLALRALYRKGFDVDLLDPAWIAKARRSGAVIDAIFCSYNGLFPVDDSWFENARSAEVLGVPVQIVGPEEMIVSKSFVAARDRFDGADISWMIRATGERLDWARIEGLMRDHWQVLLWQTIHFLYVFPSERRLIPPRLLARLMMQLGRELVSDERPAPGCRGPMLDPVLYLAEVAAEGAADPRPRRELVPLREAREATGEER